MTLFTVLAVLHVTAGATALLAAVIATAAKVVDGSHKWHVVSGQTFFWAMCVVCATAVPMTIIHPSTFLLLIAIFSFYLIDLHKPQITCS